MFKNNFNFRKSEKDTISNEIRKLVTQAETFSYSPSEDEYNYLTIWKKNLLKLSGNN